MDRHTEQLPLIRGGPPPVTRTGGMFFIGAGEPAVILVEACCSCRSGLGHAVSHSRVKGCRHPIPGLATSWGPAGGDTGRPTKSGPGLASCHCSVTPGNGPHRTPRLIGWRCARNPVVRDATSRNHNTLDEYWSSQPCGVFVAHCRGHTSHILQEGNKLT